MTLTVHRCRRYARFRPSDKASEDSGLTGHRTALFVFRTESFHFVTLRPTHKFNLTLIIIINIMKMVINE